MPHSQPEPLHHSAEDILVLTGGISLACGGPSDVKNMHAEHANPAQAGRQPTQALCETHETACPPAISHTPGHMLTEGKGGHTPWVYVINSVYFLKGHAPCLRVKQSQKNEAFLGGPVVKNPPANAWALVQKNPTRHGATKPVCHNH